MIPTYPAFKKQAVSPPPLTKAERLAKAREALRKLIEFRSGRPVAKQAAPGARSLDTAIDKLREYVQLVDRGARR